MISLIVYLFNDNFNAYGKYITKSIDFNHLKTSKNCGFLVFENVGQNGKLLMCPFRICRVIGRF